MIKRRWSNWKQQVNNERNMVLGSCINEDLVLHGWGELGFTAMEKRSHSL